MGKWFAEHLKPDDRARDLLHVDYRQLFDRGIRLILLDIDNTLVRHGARRADEFAVEAVSRMQKAGFQIMIISNARQDRAGAFARTLNLPYIGMANKPSIKALREACRITGVGPQVACMIGDQLLTDIWAGRRAGVLTILVEPRFRQEAWNVRLKRPLENNLIRKITDHGGHE